MIHLFHKKPSRLGKGNALARINRSFNILFLVIAALIVIVVLLLINEARLIYQEIAAQKMLAEDVKHQTISFDVLQQSLELQKQQNNNLIQQMSVKFGETQKTLLQQQQQTLQNMLAQLQTELQQSQSPSNVTPNLSPPPAGSSDNSTRQIAPGYAIYGVEPYGVVIETPNGQFEVAYIGRQLPIGEITEISADMVQVGKWIIVRQPSS